MDIVTVTTTKHKDAMLLHSFSLNRLLEPACTHWVIIEDSATSEEEWTRLLAPIYTRHTLKIVYVPISQDDFNVIGWCRQQVFKFTIADLIDSEYYCILDTKNILIRPTNFDQWDVEEGNNTIQREGAIGFEKWTSWIDRCANLLGREKPERYWSPETPFKVKTSKVKEIINAVDLVKEFSDKRTDLSEFILYRFFTDVKPKGPPKPNGKGNLNKSFWDSTQLVNTDQLNEILEGSSITMISIHHGCIVDQSPNLHKLLNWLHTECGFDLRYIKPLMLTQ